jgi:endoglucanase
MKYLLSLMIYLLIMIFAIRAQDYPSSVCIDQEGFYPKAQKVAIVTCRVKDNQFYVIRRSNLDTVYRGILSSVRHSSNSSLITRIADFSPLCKTGIFQVVVPGISISYPFRIEADVHRKAALASLKAFYYLRASEDLQPGYAGKWSRRGGHPDTAVTIHASAATPGRKMGSMIPTPCGWYDAGDYNKYIVNSGISTATLLSAFEDFAPYFDTLHTHIPPIGKNVPDILNETLYNLR